MHKYIYNIKYKEKIHPSSLNIFLLCSDLRMQLFCVAELYIMIWKTKINSRTPFVWFIRKTWWTIGPAA